MKRSENEKGMGWGVGVAAVWRRLGFSGLEQVAACGLPELEINGWSTVLGDGSGTDCRC